MPKQVKDTPSIAKQVGIWIRVSTDDQAQGDSPEHHEKRARMYAESKGWNVTELYNLAGVSGKAVMSHPETQRMLKDVKAGRITGLIFSKLARLARNARELLEFADVFDKAGADLISLHENIDTSTPSGRLFYTMFAALSQWEREEIAGRVAATVPIRAKLGKPLGGPPPYGYRWVNKQLVPDPNEAPIVKLMYELFLDHRRNKTVARLLNERGFRTRTGCRFSDMNVRRLLLDTTPKGLHRANYTTGKWPHVTLKPESEWVYHPVEPIISEEVWGQVNQILAERFKGKKPAKKAVQLFAGLVRCTCGHKMYVYVGSPKYVCKQCKNKIPIVDLDGIYYEQLKNFLLSPEDIGAYLANADELIRTREEQLRTLEHEAKRVTEEMDSTYRLYLQKKISVEGFGQRYLPLEERQKQLNDQIPRLQGEIDYLKISYLSSDQVLHNAKDLYSRWPNLDFDGKRRIVENITESITVGQDEIDIHLYYLPQTSSSEVVIKGQHDL